MVIKSMEPARIARKFKVNGIVQGRGGFHHAVDAQINREIYLRSDDSIARRIAGAARFIRRTRGVVPLPVFLKAPLPPVPRPAGASAIKEPWKTAVSYPHDAFGDALWDLDLPLFQAVDKNRIAGIIKMIAGKINSTATSSLGRLFDGGISPGQAVIAAAMAGG